LGLLNPNELAHADHIAPEISGFMSVVTLKPSLGE
jgi:hypothetical protein